MGSSVRGELREESRELSEHAQTGAARRDRRTKPARARHWPRSRPNRPNGSHGIAARVVRAPRRSTGRLRNNTTTSHRCARRRDRAFCRRGARNDAPAARSAGQGQRTDRQSGKPHSACPRTGDRGCRQRLLRRVALISESRTRTRSTSPRRSRPKSPTRPGPATCGAIAGYSPAARSACSTTPRRARSQSCTMATRVPRTRQSLHPRFRGDAGTAAVHARRHAGATLLSSDR